MNLNNEAAYERCMQITKTSDAFYYSDHHYIGKDYRIFDYRLARLQDWLVDPITFYMRGLMYEITKDGKFIRAASTPMPKFFNLNENPLVMNLDLSPENIDTIAEKLDGSLISTFFHKENNSLIMDVKSKGSLSSQQVRDAREFIKNNWDIRYILGKLAHPHITVNMEWCSPKNRIVVSYNEPSLRVLNMVNRETGEVIDLSSEIESHPQMWARRYPSDMDLTKVAGMRGIEGFIVRLKTGETVKIKTDQYVTLHAAKDAIASPKKIAAVILDGSVDDVKGMFGDDPMVIAEIEKMEKLVIEKHNEIAKVIHDWVTENRHLDRKSFAIATKTSYKAERYFSLIMNEYLGRPQKLGEWMLREFDELFGDIDYKLEGTSM